MKKALLIIAIVLVWSTILFLVYGTANTKNGALWEPETQNDVSDGNVVITQKYGGKVALTLTVTELGGGYYHLSLDAEWREMPKSRKKDDMSLSYADSVQLLLETQDGWYSYARDGEYGEKYAVEENDFLAFDGHSGMKITLPRNGVTLKDGKLEYVEYTGMKMHYECRVLIKDLASEAEFQMNFYYAHDNGLLHLIPGFSDGLGGIEIDEKTILIYLTQEHIHYVPEENAGE